MNINYSYPRKKRWNQGKRRWEAIIQPPQPKPIKKYKEAGKLIKVYPVGYAFGVKRIMGWSI